MAKGKVNIPYPHQSINHPVVYNWPAGTGGNGDTFAAAFWERRRLAAENSAAGKKLVYDDNYADLTALGARMVALGQAERKKELALLKRMLPDFNFEQIDEMQLIAKLNEIMKGKEQFKYALDRIQAAMNFSKKNAKITGEAFKGMGPSMASTFLSYLGTEMSALFRKFISQLDARKPTKDWGVFLEANFDSSVDKAMNKMLEYSKIGKDVDKIYGDAEQWRAIGEAYRILEPFQQQFRGMLRSKLNISQLKKIFKDGQNQAIINRAKQKGVKSGFRTLLNKDFKWKSRQYSIGGSVAEYLEVLIAKAMPKGGTISDRATKVLEGETIRTDSIDIFNFNIDGDVSVDRLVEQINDTLLNTVSLSDASNKLETFYNNNLANLDDTFIVYTSTKNYSLGAGFSGFHNGKDLSLSRLTDYINAAGLDASIGEDFLDVAYNTLNTAIYSEEREEVAQNIENILTSAAAKLMFDDWTTIGVPNNGAQQLHVFDLDGVIVPSSVLFINLGIAMQEAVKDMRTWVSVRVYLPKTVLYHPGDWTKFGDSNESIKNGIYHMWEEQARVAEDEAHFSVKFLYNFKSLMNKLIMSV